MLQKLSTSSIILIIVTALLISPYTYIITDADEAPTEVIFQVDENHPPFEFTSGDDIYGFGLDLGRMIFSAGNYNVQYSSDIWSDVYNRIKNGEIDVCSLTAITESRKKEVLFTKPVVRTFRAVYTRNAIFINAISDIKEFRIGVQKSDYSEAVLQNELGIKNYLTYKDLEECIHALKEGSIDVVFGNQEVINYLLVKHQLFNDITPRIMNLYPTDLAYGINRNKPELLSFMNEQIDKLQKSGLYEQVFQKHFYRHSEYYKAEQQRKLIYLGLFLLFVVLTTLVFSNVLIRQLRKMVDKATGNLKKEHETLRTTLLSITDGVVAVNTYGKITFMNHVAEQLTGFAEKDSIDKPLDEVLNILDPDTGTRYEVPVLEVLDNGFPVNFNNLNILVSQGGSQHLILGSASPIKNDTHEVIGVLVAFQDISEKKQSEETIKYHEYYDSLTDLPNRKLFHQYLNSAIESAFRNNHKLAVLIIDLDYFKNINNSLGHHIGDSLLQQAAKRLIRMLNENDVLARMGGDEFTILMPQIESLDQAYTLAAKVVKELSHVYMIDEHELYITASIGIALYPDDGSESSVILKHADTALYNAKANGRNTYKSYIVLDDEKIMQKFNLIKELHTALERNEMTLHYQPKVDSATGTVVGMEALIRWIHPVRGVISPGVFIPLAEETGLIKQLDTWVLKTACSQFSGFNKAYGKPLRLSVNLSAYQFRNHNLVNTIEQVIEETSFNPSQLELEITETTAMENIDFTIRTLNKLNDMGVNISIDDFGTGYSSLNYLRYFPIQILKIDRSFINDMENDQNTKVIVKSIIDVAHSLKLKVTAEGVETAEQLSLLKQMKCDEMQGFLISKPMPLLEIQKNILPGII